MKNTKTKTVKVFRRMHWYEIYRLKCLCVYYQQLVLKHSISKILIWPKIETLSLFDPFPCPSPFPLRRPHHSCGWCPGSTRSRRVRPLVTPLPSTTSPTSTTTRLVAIWIISTLTSRSTRPTSSKARLMPWDSLPIARSSFSP